MYLEKQGGWEEVLPICMSAGEEEASAPTWDAACHCEDARAPAQWPAWDVVNANVIVVHGHFRKYEHIPLTPFQQPWKIMSGGSVGGAWRKKWWEGGRATRAEKGTCHMGLNPICWGARHTCPPPPAITWGHGACALHTGVCGLREGSRGKRASIAAWSPSKSSKIGLEVGLDPHPRSWFQNETSSKP